MAFELGLIISIILIVALLAVMIKLGAASVVVLGPAIIILLWIFGGSLGLSAITKLFTNFKILFIIMGSVIFMFFLSKILGGNKQRVVYVQ